jgi:uncharacterized linocin/CFP29 family protein
MDILKRQLAPITEAAWQEIEAEAKHVFALNLSARRVVDVSGPLGLDAAAVNLGRLQVPKKAGKGPLRYGVRQVLPVVEARASFELDIWELDNLDRGAVDPDLDALRAAARELARFEERAVYEGLPEAGLTGLLEAAQFEAVPVTAEAAALPEAIARSVLRLRYADVEGPYALALGAALYQLLAVGTEQGYPIRRRIADLIDGPIVLAPFLEGGVLVSRRGGDTEMTLGQDISIGYESHNSTTVRLYFSESFAFRVPGPEAVVPLAARETTG